MAIETVTIKDANGVSRDVAADQVGTAFWQVLKVAFGTDGAGTLVDASNPLPVDSSTLLGALSAPAAGTVNAQLAALLARLPAALVGGALSVAPTGAGDGASTLTDGRKTVTTPGTAVALVAASTPCKWVTATALLTNTQPVSVGGSGVLATVGNEKGSPLNAGDSITIPVDNAQKVFVDARVAGEGVSFTIGT